MKIGILGAGAMGSLFGANFMRIGHQVCFIDKDKNLASVIKNNGVTIIGKQGEFKVFPSIFENSLELGEVELLMVFVKACSTEKAIKYNLNLIGKNTILLTLQNGYGNGDTISKYVNKENIIIGTTSNGANVISPGKVVYAGSGQTFIGKLCENSSIDINIVSDIFKRAGFETTVSCKIQHLVWEKLLINAAINALTAIMRVKNGELLNYKESLEIMNKLVQEGCRVANKKHVIIDFNEIIEKVKQVAKNTKDNKSSMLQDILLNRKTEIDFINGAIVNEGKINNVSTPVNEAIYNIIKLIEKCNTGF